MQWSDPDYFAIFNIDGTGSTTPVQPAKGQRLDYRLVWLDVSPKVFLFCHYYTLLLLLNFGVSLNR